MFRLLLDHHQAYKELNRQRIKDFFGTHWDPLTYQRNPLYVAYSAHCRPDDGRVTTETCCLNESKIRPPVNRLN